MKIWQAILTVMMLATTLVTAREKGMSSMPSYYPQMNYHAPMAYSSMSYAPVYHAKAVDSYAYNLPQYSFQNDYKAMMPVVKYVSVQSVPYMGPTTAFYPSQSYGGGYGGGYGGMMNYY